MPFSEHFGPPLPLAQPWPLSITLDEVPPGTILSTSCCGVARHMAVLTHHGTVIEYRGKPFGEVVETSVHDFSAGRKVRIEHLPCSKEHGEVIVSRAYSRLGERGYDMFANNCEHLTSWSYSGVATSIQVEQGVRVGAFIAITALATVIISEFTQDDGSIY